MLPDAIPLILVCDGGVEPFNPGGVGTYGWIATRGGLTVATGQGYLGEGADITNNVAEYLAIYRAAAWLVEIAWDAGPVILRSDSQLAVQQLNGRWNVSAGHLRLLHDEITPYLAQLPSFSLEWVPRADTLPADALARAAFHDHVQQHGDACVVKRGRKP